ATDLITPSPEATKGPGSRALGLALERYGIKDATIASGNGGSAKQSDLAGVLSEERPARARFTRSVSELFAQDAFIEVVSRIEQHVHAGLEVHGDVDAVHMANFVVIGDGGHRTLARFQHFDRNPRLVRQQRAAPAPRPEWADRCECHQRGTDWN